MQKNIKDSPRNNEKLGLSDGDLANRPTSFSKTSFEGQVVLISGAAGGLGRATAWLLGRLGAKLILVGRDQSKLENLADALRAKDIAAEAIALDIRDSSQINSLFEVIKTKYGNLDLLINSAGGQFPMPATEISENGWNAVINTNLTGTWLMMQAAARFWKNQDLPGSIVNIVVVTRQGLYGIAHSVAARAGVIGLSKNLSVEWAPLNIRVNCIAPGAIETEGWKVYSEEAYSKYSRSNPMMRNGNSWDIAEACAYLGSNASNYITGEVLHVAGGGQNWGETWTINKPEYFNND